MKDMWITNAGRTAPHDLKQTLGSRVQRFAGYGQQDSAELVNFLVDLLHEDCNRVKKKPFIEMSEETGRPDEVVAKEYWDAYTARNKSMIVDLMTGQLKSTVTCLTCGWVSVAFDPM
jgi:ubiquitin C-terminal hydrolase